MEEVVRSQVLRPQRETGLRGAVLDARDLDSEQAWQAAVHRRGHALAQGIHRAARYMPLPFRSVPGSLTDEQVRAAVQEALDGLPTEFASQLGEVAVVIEDSHPDDLMGIYDPVGGLERIVIFRDANPTAEEVRRTVLHEVGHYFGMDEQRLHDLGYG
jgi:predicted Zn-dependent protease with MMP-like domain